MTFTGERIGKRDITIAVVLSLLGVWLMLENVLDEKVDANDFAVPAFLAVTVPLLWRRAAPIAALAAVFAALGLHTLLFGSDVVRCGVVLPTVFLLAFSAGARLERREALIGLGLGFLSITIEGVNFLGGFAVVMAGLAAAIWATGRVVRSRGHMADELAARTAELREARDERARLEVATDRARMSRELDELLRRRLGELAQMAGDDPPGDPAGATATLVDIECASRRTLEEMRELVGVLREDDSEAATAPQPTLIHLEAMLVRAKGGDARLSVEGNPRALPAGVELSAYRIVEHLLAALEDSPEVEVRVRFADDALEIAVSGRARRRGQAAIERARERVQLHRGTLETTVRGGRAAAVAQLPVLLEA